MTRRPLFYLLAAAVLAVFAGVLAAAMPAAAQEGPAAVRLAQVDPLAKFFRGIFGGGRPRQRERERDAPPRPRQNSEPAVPKVQAKPKDEDARVVMVFGDSVAAGLARGLEEAFAEDTGVRAEEIAEGTSGLVRDDHYNWPKKIAETLENPDTRISVAVIAIGINDRQQFRLDDVRVDFRTQEWEKLYEKRTREVMQLFFERRIPVIWVGLAPAKSGQMSADFLYMNRITRETAEEFGASFVDVWTSFLDENERYSAYGPDVAGQKRLLRRSDGVNFTRAGARKLAFFVEKQIRRVIGTSALVSLPGLSTQRTGPDPRATGIGYVFDLTGPIAAGNGELAGAPDEQPLRTDETSAYQQVMVEGAALPVVGGEAIDPEADARLPATDENDAEKAAATGVDAAGTSADAAQ